MQTREEKDAKTLAIVRALLIFAIVLVTTSLLLALVSWLGVDELGPAYRVVVGLAGLLCVGYLLRHRNG